MPFNKDSLYASSLGEIASFKFVEPVVNVFVDMMRRFLYHHIILRSVCWQGGIARKTAF